MREGHELPDCRTRYGSGPRFARKTAFCLEFSFKIKIK
jgi:hypothetical protein